MTKDWFIQIPSYRDRELEKTLLDLFSKAAHPDRLRVCVAWQHSKRERLSREVTRLPNPEIIATPVEQSQGPNWARRQLQDRYRGEAFILFLDSHHRFVHGWDDRLLNMFMELKRSGISKPLITAYLPAYTPSHDPRGRSRGVLKIYPLKRTNGLLTHLTGRTVTLWQWLKGPLPADFVSLHFLFAEGVFNQEVLFDPEIYFFGDEVFTSLRAFTFGYTFFHPHRLIGWHVYDRGTRTPHWDDHADWHVSERRSFERMRKIIQGRLRPRGYLSSNRSVREFEEHIGLSLIED